MDIAQIILESIILILGLYLVFFKSYFQEKGKNIATKEDIEEITTKVEKVKNEIHYNIEAQYGLKMEERKALFNYYEKYSFWFNTLIESDFSGIDDNTEKLDEITINIDKAKFDYELARARMDLLVQNKDLSKLTPDLWKKTFEMQRLKTKTIGEINIHLVKMNNFKATVSDDKGVKDYQQLLDELFEIIKKHHKELLKLTKLVVPIIEDNKKLIYSILQNIDK